MNADAELDAIRERDEWAHSGPPLRDPLLGRAARHAFADRRVLLARLDAITERERALRTLVDEQAEDKGLWFIARTAPEAYLQQELRKLHAVIDALEAPDA